MLFISTVVNGDTLFNQYQLRRDTASNWTRYNPVLLQGEPGFEYDANRLKIGDGLSHWINLPYLGNIYGSSTSMLTIGTGTKTLTVEAGLSFITGMVVEITYATDVSDYMLGTITSYNYTTGILVVNVTNTSGSGSALTPWVIWVASGPAGPKGDKGDSVTGPQGPQGPTGPAGENSASLNSTRQTVLNSAVDANGHPNFISTGTGLLPALAATTTPVYVSFAAGFEVTGRSDYVGAIVADTAWPAVQAYANNYLYASRDSGTGAITLGSTPYKPSYSVVAPTGAGQNAAVLANFDGTNGATTFTDTYGNVWTGTTDYAVISTAQSKYGTASAYTPYIYPVAGPVWNTTLPYLWSSHPWVIEFYYRPTQTSGNNYPVVYGESLRSLQLTRNSFNHLEIFMSSAGNSQDIANGNTGTATLLKDNWYHIAIVWSGLTYKIYVDGVQDIAVTSSLSIYNVTGLFYLGIETGLGFSADGGYYDEFRYTPYARYTTAFTPPTALSPDTLYYYNILQAIMYSGYYNNWVTPTQVVFVGEALAGATTITSVINYALNGRYDSGELITHSGGSYPTLTTLYDYMGVDLKKVFLWEGYPGLRTQIYSKDFTLTEDTTIWTAINGNSRISIERGF
jgi:hypothetical protein